MVDHVGTDVYHPDNDLLLNRDSSFPTKGPAQDSARNKP
jgi:hypothetical protein